LKLRYRISESRFTVGVAVSAFFGLLTILVIVGLVSWSSNRFTRISVCTTCHEVFVDFKDYKPVGRLSVSTEDYNPSKEFDPGFYDVTVGCAECHAYPFEEYRESAHYENNRGVKPGCVGCHDSHSVMDVLLWKFFYVNKGELGESPFHAISNSLRDVQAWENLRITLAGRVRKRMIEDRGAKCRVCHKTESKWFKKIERHQSGEKTCVQCHYNLVHKDVKWSKIKK
jgi:nitrate/TMAO reductase-like tetraheme cytochrome c subunit